MLRADAHGQRGGDEEGGERIPHQEARQRLLGAPLGAPHVAQQRGQLRADEAVRGRAPDAVARRAVRASRRGAQRAVDAGAAEDVGAGEAAGGPRGRDGVWVSFFAPFGRVGFGFGRLGGEEPIADTAGVLAFWHVGGEEDLEPRGDENRRVVRGGHDCVCVDGFKCSRVSVVASKFSTGDCASMSFDRIFL